MAVQDSWNGLLLISLGPTAYINDILTLTPCFSVGTNIYIYIYGCSSLWVASLLSLPLIFSNLAIFPSFIVICFGIRLFLVSILFLCGKLANDLLPIDSARQKLGFHLASECGSDDLNHFFWFCPFAQEVWRVVAMHIGFNGIPWGSFWFVRDCSTYWCLCRRDKRLFINKLFPILICGCL